MRYNKKFTELVNEFKDSIENLKILTSGVKTSVKNKKESLYGLETGNEREQSSSSSSSNTNIEQLETKITRLESKLFSYFGDDLSKDVDQTECHSLAKNHLILRYIFCLLDVSSLKNCRRVCKSWEEISEPIFRKGVKIQLKYFGNTLEKFSQDFPLDSVSCNSFVFNSMAKCSLSMFTNLLRLNSEMMTSLEMSNIDLVDEDGKVNSFKIDSFIGSKIMTLKIGGSRYSSGGTQIVLSLNRLKRIEYLHLESCVLILTGEGESIKPREISLNDVSFIRENGEQLGDVRLNDFIEFHRSTKIEFDATFNMTRHNENTHFIFPQDIQMDSVHLSAINYSWKQSNKPRIKNIKVSSANLNINVLSEEVETLCFTSLGQTNRQNVFLPKLKYLTCPSGDTILFSRLSVFSNCPNLVAVNLQNLLGTNLECNLNWLPASVKNIKLESIKVIGDSFERPLTSLHLINYTWQSIDSILTKFTAENLYISIKNQITYTRFPFAATDTLLRISRQPFKTFAVGKIVWADQEDFRNSEFSNFVDKRSECYLFQNGVGKTIPQDKLDILVNSFP